MAFVFGWFIVHSLESNYKVLELEVDLRSSEVHTKQCLACVHYGIVHAQKFVTKATEAACNR